jgi:hypothetical protein
MGENEMNFTGNLKITGGNFEITGREFREKEI